MLPGYLKYRQPGHGTKMPSQDKWVRVEIVPRFEWPIAMHRVFCWENTLLPINVKWFKKKISILVVSFKRNFKKLWIYTQNTKCQ